MQIFLFKVGLTPLLITMATVIGRRWGPVMGGWFTGLPLTSGPISVFLVLEQGRSFAAEAAQSSLLGLSCIAIFCVAYALSAEDKNWRRSSLTALCVYGASLWCVSFLAFSLFFAILFSLVCLWAALRIIGVPTSKPAASSPPRRDLPARIGTTLVLVLTITGLASFLGPKWSGLLSTFPAFTWIMALFAHAQTGAAAARQVMHGIIAASFATVAFFSLVGLAVHGADLFMLYLLAVLFALAVDGIVLVTLVREGRDTR